MPEAPPRVFISYSHDSPEHQDRVLDLADRLRADGIDASIDQYEQSPPEGWPAWCEAEIDKADFVLVVCTPTYHERMRREQPPGTGQGVLWEARLIKQELYDHDSAGRKFVPVLFADGRREDIPRAIKGTSFFWIETAEGYEALYRLLTDQPGARKRDLGILRRLPERQQRSVAVPADPGENSVGYSHYGNASGVKLSMGWSTLKSELNTLFPDKAEVIRLIKRDPVVENVGPFPVDKDLAEEIANAPTPKYNELHGLLADEPYWNDDPVILKYLTADYKTIKALRARGDRPPVLSACALVCNSTDAEIVLHRRSETVETYKGSLHIFGGNFRAAGDKDPDADLAHGLQRELWEEAALSAGPSLSKLDCARVLARETFTGFIQLGYFGVDFPPEQVARIRLSGEGRPVHVQFSELGERLCDPKEKWVHSGQLLILLWLALGAPTARVDGKPAGPGFDSALAKQLYRQAVSRLSQRK